MPVRIERCLICGGSNNIPDDKATYFLNLVEPFVIRKCAVCDFLWLDPQPTKDEYSDLYSSAYLGAQRQRQTAGSLLSLYPPREEKYEEEVMPLRTAWFQARLKRLRKIARHGRTLLDIGAGTGDFVALAAAEGWKAEGLEVSSYACERAFDKYGVTLICSDIDEYILNATNKFDVIHLSHVFEHLTHPREFLHGARNLLNKDGCVIIEVPNQFRSWSDRIVNLRNGVKQIDRSTFSIHHPYYYGTKHLRILLHEEGYRLISARTFFAERMVNPKEAALGIVDLVGDLCGGHGRNIEIIAVSR